MIERDKMSEKEIRDWYVSKHGLEANDDGTKDYYVHKAFLKAWDEKRPHGKWILVKPYTFACSLCGRLEEHQEPFCNCGAKMEIRVGEAE